MPLDVVRRLLTPLRDPVATSRYPRPRRLCSAGDAGPAGDRPELGATATAPASSACPTGAIEVGDGAWSIDAGRCVFCGACAGLPERRDPIEHAGRARRAHERARAGRTLRARAERRSHAAPVGRRRPRESGIAAAGRATARVGDPRRLGRSLHVRHLDAGSCNGCDWEIAALLNPYHDVQRLGIDFVASPRHADLLLVTGVMTRNLEEAARRTYEAMPEPRLVVAVGACAISGGVFAGLAGAASGVGGHAAGRRLRARLPAAPRGADRRPAARPRHPRRRAEPAARAVARRNRAG